MRAIGLALLQPRIPRLDIRQGRPVDFELEIAIELRAGRSVAHGQCIARNKSVLAQVSIQKLKQDGAAGNALAYQVPVPLVFRRR